MTLLPILGGILIGALGSACCYHLVAARGQRMPTQHLLVASLCLLAVGFAAMMILSLRETSVERLLYWNRVGLVFGVAAFPLMVQFYDHPRRTLARRAHEAIWLSALLVIAANLFLPQGVQFSQVAGIQWRPLPWGESYASLHGTLHPLFGVAALWFLLLTALCGYIQWGNWRQNRQTPELVLLAGIAIYLLSVVLGVLSRAGYVNLHFTGVYGLAAMVLSISLVYIHDDRRGRQREAEEKRRHRARLEWLARHDPLTGLPNLGALEEALQTASPAPDSLLALLDVDHLGRINEAFGHDTGDTLLQALARRLESLLAPCDRLCRLGGDQLCLLLDGEGALARLQQLQAATRAPFELASGLQLELGVSGGYTRFAGNGATIATSLQQAESALHAAKRAALGGLLAFDASLFERSRRWTRLGSRLRSALQRGEFRLVYQPRVSLQEGVHAGFEALLRWRDGETDVEPGEFVRIAEESGFIGELGDYVLKNALTQLRDWHAQGLPHGRLAINLSMRQLGDTALPARIAAALAAHALPASMLELEITETVAMERSELVLPQMLALASAGHTLAIDDFGTGHSSLARLQELPCAVIKIDLAFVRRLGTPDGDQLMRSLLGLVRDLGREPVAEGVETAAQRDWLREAGCHEAQGYWYARPLEAPAATDWLRAVAANAGRVPAAQG